MVLGYFIFFYLITLSLFKFKSIQFNSIIHISKKNRDKNFVNFELFQLQFFSTVVLGYFIFFISVHFFCPIQFNFISYISKKNISTNFVNLNYYRSNCLFPPWSLVIFLFNAINSIQFNSNQFYLITLQKRTHLRNLSIFNYFRSNCLYPPWSWVISFSLLFNSIKFSFPFVHNANGISV